MDPDDQVRNVWNLGYISSDKEESNDTDQEETSKYIKDDKPVSDEDEDIDTSSLPFLVDYTSPLNSFCFVNVQDQPVQAGTQIFSCYGSRTNMFLLENYGFAILPNKYNSL